MRSIFVMLVLAAGCGGAVETFEAEEDVAATAWEDETRLVSIVPPREAQETAAPAPEPAVVDSIEAPACLEDVDCDDGNECTWDYCHPQGCYSPETTDAQPCGEAGEGVCLHGVCTY